MNKKLKLFLLLLLVFGSFFNVTNAVNLMISPIKYEIDTPPTSIVKRTATLYNRSDDTLTIYTGKADFEARDNSGKPYFIPVGSKESTGQELSGWINIDQESFEIGPRGEKQIEFSINVPANATPGGHYGAVFFKNKNANDYPGTQIAVNEDYGILLLLNVEGKVIKDAVIGGSVITNYSKLLTKQKDKCFFGIDLTGSDYDNKCFDLSVNNFKTKIFNPTIGEKFEDNTNNTGNLDNNFKIGFDIPIENKGNTHIKPEGKIVLKDEDGKQINGIGKEIIKNDNGVIVGEKIVDYIPLNDVGGNVLPNSKRDFTLEWKGFPYKAYDDEGNQIIKFWTPEDYYSMQNKGDRKFLMPWEMEKEKISEKNIKALIDVTYKNADGEDVVFNSAKDFGVTYKERYIAINPYFMILLGLIIILIIFILFVKRKVSYKKCIHCKKKINKKMKICPYCGEEQKHNSKKEIVHIKKDNTDIKTEPNIKTKSKSNINTEDKPKIKAKSKSNIDIEDKPKIKAKSKSNIDIEDKPKIKAKSKSNIDIEDKPKIKDKPKSSTEKKDKPNTKTKKNIEKDKKVTTKDKKKKS